MQKKQGISLIVLVITIIVMIILAASVVITLSNTGVINRASQAVGLTNESAVQDLAALIWADAYMDNKRGTDLVNEVTIKLGEQGVTADKWNISVTDTGVTVTNKGTHTGTTLGSLIKGPEDYGKTIDYTVTVEIENGRDNDEYFNNEVRNITFSNWRVLYEDENKGYVYIIPNDGSKYEFIYDIPRPSNLILTEEEQELYKKFQVGNGPHYTLVGGNSDNESEQVVVRMVKNNKKYANKSLYGEYVIGSIGGITIELFVECWKALNKSPNLELTVNESGYLINGKWYSLQDVGVQYTENDPWYVMECATVASPAGDSYLSWEYIENTIISDDSWHGEYIVPVVCLSSNIPATVGTTTDFSLVK